jgi:two-component system, NtrC family, response regulator HydG
MIERRKRVLVLDDEDDALFIISSFLKKLNYEVAACRTIKDVNKNLVLTGDFDLFILDYNLQDGSGLDVVETIRNKGIISPVVICSADTSLSEQIIKHDINEFIPKPIDLELFITIVKKLI